MTCATASVTSVLIWCAVLPSTSWNGFGMSCRGVSAVSVGFGGGMSGGMSVGIALGMSVGMVVGMVLGMHEGTTLAPAAALLLPIVSVVASQPTTCDTNSSRAQRP